ncbi:MAG: hypothetical protein FWG53_04805 [Clostridiales bacterium]|nr:hypothetical protein [Clostridiales bacterium]
MKRKITIAVCCILALCSFSGCQLAKESLEAGPLEDRLIGAYVTMGHTSLFDREDRLEAVLKTRETINEETGEIEKTEEYVFEGAEGIPYFIPTITTLPGHNSYVAAMSNDAISDGYTNLHYGDDTNSVTLEGTIYAIPTKTERIFHVNPVYQREDGSVYAAPSAGVSASGIDTEGSAMFQTLDAVYTVAENGKTKTDSVSITVSIKVMFAPEKIVILQMNEFNEVLTCIDYEPGAVPEVLAPERGAAYFIVETHKKDATGSPKTTREIYDRDAESFETYYVRADGICVKHGTQISKKGRVYGSVDLDR